MEFLVHRNSLFLSDWRNLITYCYIHNDSTVELSKCGTMIASFEVANTKKLIYKRNILSKKKFIIIIFFQTKFIDLEIISQC